MNETHETDQLIAVLTDALEIYGRPDDGLPQHLAAVIRREYGAVNPVARPEPPIRLWDGNLQYITGDYSPIEVTRNGDDRTVLVAEDSPIALAMRDITRHPAADLHLSIEGDTPLTRWSGRVHKATKVEGGISIEAVCFATSYRNALDKVMGDSMKDAS